MCWQLYSNILAEFYHLIVAIKYLQKKLLENDARWYKSQNSVFSVESLDDKSGLDTFSLLHYLFPQRKSQNTSHPIQTTTNTYTFAT